MVIKILKEALATEIVCVLRYKRHHYTAKGIHSLAVAEEFLEHANEEQGHADKIAERITQLDGEPNFDPAGLLSRSHSQYVEGDTLVEMIKEDLIAERIAIESYSEIIRYLADNDPTSRRLMEEILANEEEHAEEMKTLLESIGNEEKKSEGSRDAGHAACSRVSTFGLLSDYKMATTSTFRFCRTCGSPHGRSKCPVACRWNGSENLCPNSAQ